MKIEISRIRVESRHRADHGDIDELAASIDRLGLLQPIGIDPAQRLVFGERRLMACKRLGMTTIPVRIVDLPSIVEGEYAENEMRKDFTPSERVAIVQTIQEQIGERRGRPGENVADLPHLEPGTKTRDHAAELAGFSSTTQARQATKVVDYGAPELVEAMDSGKASISAAADVATLPKEEQREVVAKGEKEILEAAKNIRKARTAKRRAERMEAISVALPTGKYNIIYADPPWQYEHAASASREVENHYPTMNLEDICTLPVHELIGNDAILFLWVPNPKLEEGMRVLNTWGFSYRTNMAWIKDRLGMGYYVRQQHELLFIGRKGDMPPPEPAVRPNSVINSPRTDHSHKPECVFGLIETMYPEGKYLELFSRKKRENWTTWGNQV